MSAAEDIIAFARRRGMNLLPWQERLIELLDIGTPGLSWDYSRMWSAGVEELTRHWHDISPANAWRSVELPPRATDEQFALSDYVTAVGRAVDQLADEADAPRRLLKPVERYCSFLNFDEDAGTFDECYAVADWHPLGDLGAWRCDEHVTQSDDSRLRRIWRNARTEQRWNCPEGLRLAPGQCINAVWSPDGFKQCPEPVAYRSPGGHGYCQHHGEQAIACGAELRLEGTGTMGGVDLFPNATGGAKRHPVEDYYEVGPTPRLAGAPHLEPITYAGQHAPPGFQRCCVLCPGVAAWRDPATGQAWCEFHVDPAYRTHRTT